MDRRHQSQPRHLRRRRLPQGAGRRRHPISRIPPGAYHGCAGSSPAFMKIRPVEPRDRERIHQILVGTNRFTEEEVRCADELVQSAVEHPEKGDYIVHVLEEPDSGPHKAVQGYACYGPTPMTDGVFDLYWIAVDPRQQGLGFGQLLLRFVENEVRRQRGRMLLIETSSKESYGPTMRFYEHSGYDEISRIKDFYRIEDDKVVFCKKLP